MKSSPSDFCLFTKGKFFFLQSKICELNQRIWLSSDFTNNNKSSLRRQGSYQNDLSLFKNNKLLFHQNKRMNSYKTIKDNPRIINSKSRHLSMQSLDYYNNMLPKQEKLLRGQNQLILERLKKKPIINSPKLEKSKVGHQEVRLNNQFREAKKSSIEGRKRELNDTDKMAVEISECTNDINKSLHEDNYAIIKPYQYASKAKEEIGLIQSNQKFTNQTVCENIFIRDQSQSNYSESWKAKRIKSDKINYSTSNSMKIIRLLAQKYNSQKNCKEEIEVIPRVKEINQGLNKDKQNYKNITQSSNWNNTNSDMTLLKKGKFKNCFSHSKSTTDINWNNDTNLLLSNNELKIKK